MHYILEIERIPCSNKNSVSKMNLVKEESLKYIV